MDVTQTTCPVDHRLTSHGPMPTAPGWEYETRGSEQVLVLRSMALARALLRLPQGTRQAGFQADLLVQAHMRAPMLYQEGPGHREQRRAAARFFAPRTVTTVHEPVLVRLADELVGQMEKQGGGSLDDLSFRMALTVVVQLVGLTASPLSGIESRLKTFFDEDPKIEHAAWRRARQRALSMSRSMHFHLRDVRPAIDDHRRFPRSDVISHLIEQGMKDMDILTEVLTYVAAGMVTTRQFISVAAWQLARMPQLRERYLAAPQAERLQILAEILRLDSVAGHLLRRTTQEMTIEADGERIDLPAGQLVDIAVHATNVDPTGVGPIPTSLDPDRSFADGVARAGLAFGAGHHSCPGEFLAMHETDILLRRLFRNEVRITQEPTIGWNTVAQAYELQDFQIALGEREATLS